jgi:hypothetical protein
LLKSGFLLASKLLVMLNKEVWIMLIFQIAPLMIPQDHWEAKSFLHIEGVTKAILENSKGSNKYSHEDSGCILVLFSISVTF